MEIYIMAMIYTMWQKILPFIVFAVVLGVGYLLFGEIGVGVIALVIVLCYSYGKIVDCLEEV